MPVLVRALIWGVKLAPGLLSLNSRLEQKISIGETQRVKVSQVSSGIMRESGRLPRFRPQLLNPRPPVSLEASPLNL